MKALTLTLVLLVGGLGMALPRAQAFETLDGAIEHASHSAATLTRGIANVVTGWMEMPKMAMEGHTQKGLDHALQRTHSGVMDIVHFATEPKRDSAVDPDYFSL